MSEWTLNERDTRRESYLKYLNPDWSNVEQRCLIPLDQVIIFSDAKQYRSLRRPPNKVSMYERFIPQTTEEVLVAEGGKESGHLLSRSITSQSFCDVTPDEST
jgi:hypothetical protein